MNSESERLLISQLSKIGLEIWELLRSYEISPTNRERLLAVNLLISQVWKSVNDGSDAWEQNETQLQAEGAAMLGEKVYQFESSEKGYEVWGQQGEHRYELKPNGGGISWGYLGSGPSHLTLALIEDCFTTEEKAQIDQADLHTLIYRRYISVPHPKRFELYEHDLRAAFKEVWNEADSQGHR